MAVLGIEFAPLNVPLKRRLETLAIFFGMSVVLYGSIFGSMLAIAIIVYTRFWWLCILYLTWIWTYDRKAGEEGSRTSEWIRNLSIWKYAKNYFPVHLRKCLTVELDPRRNYLFCNFPHGVICTGTLLAFCTNAVGVREEFPQHKSQCCTLAVMFHIPFYKHWLLSLGTRSASATSINNLLSKDEGGNILVLAVGGAEESFHCKPGQYKFVVKNRRGFVKIALENGSPLVPVISFGEIDIYSQIEGNLLRKFQYLIKKITGIVPLLIVGRGLFQYTFGIIPQRRPINIVVGKPVEVGKTLNPTQEQIEDLHRRFVDQLVHLFESEKKYHIKDHENIHVELV